MEIPNVVEYVLNHLEYNGFQGYLIGGSVRDIFNYKSPKDYDICTDATPEQVKSLFTKSYDTGLKHGTVTIVLKDEHLEVTTLRREGAYKDNRSPEEVFYTDSLKEDVARRDFTINSIAIDVNRNVYDYFSGLKDIENKIIRAVGKADQRFNEDALRLMRAIRLSAQHDFDIEENTLQAIIKNAYLIQMISKERIRDELCKILMSDYPGYGIEMLERTGLLQYIIPELCECIGFEQHNIHHDKDVFEYIISVLNNSPKILNIRLGGLLHDIGKPKTFSVDDKGTGHFYGHHIESAIMTEEILKRLKFDNKTIENVVILVRYHMDRYDKIRTTNIKKFINRIGIDNLNDLFELQIVDVKGSAKKYQDFSNVISLKEQCFKILNEKQPLTVKDLAINGHDLMNIGIQQGKEIGIALNWLLEMVLINPNLNNYEDLSEHIIRRGIR